MTTEIERLTTTAPTITLPLRAKIERVVAWVTAVIAVVSLVIGIYNIERVSHQASCINTNLGTRNAPSMHDAHAHIAFADGIVAGLTSHESRQKLIRQAETYAHTLRRDQAVRQAHPLGHC